MQYYKIFHSTATDLVLLSEHDTRHGVRDVREIMHHVWRTRLPLRPLHIIPCKQMDQNQLHLIADKEPSRTSVRACAKIYRMLRNVGEVEFVRIAGPAHLQEAPGIKLLRLIVDIGVHIKLIVGE